MTGGGGCPATIIIYPTIYLFIKTSPLAYIFKVIFLIGIVGGRDKHVRHTVVACTQTHMHVTQRVLCYLGARCSSVVRAFAHGAMGVGSVLHGGPICFFLFQPVLHDWCNTKAVVCVILSVG